MTEDQIPLPPDAGVEPPPWARDSKASEEVKLWDNEPELRGQHKRNQLWWLKVYGLIVPVMMISFTLFYLMALGAWVLHYVTPWTWLNADQLSKIQSIIFSGSVGAFVASIAHKQMRN